MSGHRRWRTKTIRHEVAASGYPHPHVAFGVAIRGKADIARKADDVGGEI